jgi:hypothetical protein
MASPNPFPSNTHLQLPIVLHLPHPLASDDFNNILKEKWMHKRKKMIVKLNFYEKSFCEKILYEKKIFVKKTIGEKKLLSKKLLPTFSRCLILFVLVPNSKWVPY